MCLGVLIWVAVEIIQNSFNIGILAWLGCMNVDPVLGFGAIGLLCEVGWSALGP